MLNTYSESMFTDLGDSVSKMTHYVKDNASSFKTALTTGNEKYIIDSLTLFKYGMIILKIIGYRRIIMFALTQILTEENISLFVEWIKSKMRKDLNKQNKQDDIETTAIEAFEEAVAFTKFEFDIG